MTRNNLLNSFKDTMAVSSGKKARKQQQSPDEAYLSNMVFREVKPLNFIQETYLKAIQSNDVIFGVGSAGTGKTYLATYFAATELFHRRVEKVIVTRPNVEVGRSMGHLPGTLEEKYEPYLAPFDQVFSKTLGAGFYDYCLKSKKIEPKPIGFMRGLTFENCIVLVDEAQNVTDIEMKMILSRIGRNSKIILSGDPEQSDIPNSGLEKACNLLEDIPGIEVVDFLDSDIVRSSLCKRIIMAYNR